jgi:glutamine synthetase
VDILPDFAKDNTDRNRTSPFAFTGNKFEFRMVGSAFSIAGPNFILNTIVAEELSRFADRLEKGESADKIIASAMAAHQRIIFNGNNYAPEWVAEAEKRGLLNLITTVDALPYFIAPKNIELFSKHGILSETEIRSRYEILMDTYCRTISIEALTLMEIIKRQVIPAACAYSRDLADGVSAKLAVVAGLPCQAEKELIGKISALVDAMYQKTALLENALAKAPNHGTDIKTVATYYRDQVFAAMNDLRAAADETEPLLGRGYWPLPTYGDLLFSV